MKRTEPNDPFAVVDNAMLEHLLQMAKNPHDPMFKRICKHIAKFNPGLAELSPTLFKKRYAQREDRIEAIKVRKFLKRRTGDIMYLQESNAQVKVMGPSPTSGCGVYVLVTEPGEQHEEMVYDKKRDRSYIKQKRIYYTVQRSHLLDEPEDPYDPKKPIARFDIRAIMGT